MENRLTREELRKIEEFPRGKKDEVYTVVCFLKNDNIDFQFTKKNIDASPEEPADIFVKDINKKFQVTWGDHEFLGKTGRAKSGGLVEVGPRRRKDVFREYIIRPLNKKSKYGKSANGIICLIRAPFDPPWLEEDLKNMNKAGTNSVLKKWGFDEIYLVCSRKNLLIYRNSLNNN